MKNAASWLQQSLGYRFKNEDLLQQALTHRSAGRQNNERLEFLGDAILDFVVSDFVYSAKPDLPEGDLSKLRSSLVRDDTLADIALELGLGEHLVLGSGEMQSGGHRRGSILADALEAVFAAVYIDGGLDAARAAVETVFAERMNNLPSVKDLQDPKTRLQEWLQARKIDLPTYELVQTTGKDHQRMFRVICVVAMKSIQPSLQSEGESTSRRKAEQKAAKEMMKKLLNTGL